jgi:hypothetical protein
MNPQPILGKNLSANGVSDDWHELFLLLSASFRIESAFDSLAMVNGCPLKVED